MLFCKLALSPMPHARVRHIDASAALAMPGVKAILDDGRTSRARRQPHRQRHRHPGKQARRAGPRDGATLSGRADPGRGCGGRIHGGRSDRENSYRPRTAAVRRRSAGEFASQRAECTPSRQCVGAAPEQSDRRSRGAGNQVDRGRICRGQGRPPAHGQGDRPMVLWRRGWRIQERRGGAR